MGTMTGTTRVVADLTYKDTAGNIATATLPVGYSDSESWTAPTRLYQARLTFVAATPQTITLDNASLSDVFGDTFNLATLTEIILVNRATTDGYDLEVSGNFVTAQLLVDWENDAVKIPVRAGGRLVMTDPNGFTVTHTTAEVITLDPGANAFDVDLILHGVNS